MIDTKQLENMFESQLATMCEQIEKVMQEQYASVINELRLRYPRRKIEIRFGMGTMVVCGFENTQYSDSYGNLKSKYEMADWVKESLPKGHPLERLVDLMDVCYPHSGHVVCCDDILMED